QDLTMDETLKEIAEYVAAKRSSAIVETAIAFGELTLTVVPTEIVELVRFLRDDPRLAFVSLIDICGVDYPAREKRFDVVYHLLSLRRNHRIRVKLATDAYTPVPSIIEIFPAANWFERETYDLYGIVFADHPDLRRLLTDYGFEGHPL